MHLDSKPQPSAPPAPEGESTRGTTKNVNFPMHFFPFFVASAEKTRKIRDTKVHYSVKLFNIFQWTMH